MPTKSHIEETCRKPEIHAENDKAKIILEAITIDMQLRDSERQEYTQKQIVITYHGASWKSMYTLSCDRITRITLQGRRDTSRRECCSSTQRTPVRTSHMPSRNHALIYLRVDMYYTCSIKLYI